MQLSEIIELKNILPAVKVTNKRQLLQELAHQAAKRGHEVMYITPSDFMMGKDDSLRAHVRRMPMKKWPSRESFFKALQESATEADAVGFDEVDVLWLRSDPSLDASTAPWRAEAGMLFGREATRR